MPSVKSVFAYFVALAILAGASYTLTFVVMRLWGESMAVTVL